MAKAILSSVLAGLRGRIDGMVFRQQAGQTVVTPRPKVSGRASTPAQLAARERFSRAAARLTLDLSISTRAWISRTDTASDCAKCASTRHSGIVRPNSAL